MARKKKAPQERWADQAAVYEPVDGAYQIGFDTVATSLSPPAGGRKYVVWYGESRLAKNQRRPVAYLERAVAEQAWIIRSLDGAVLVGLGEGFGNGSCLTRDDAVVRLGWKIDGRSPAGKHFQTWRKVCSIADPPEEDEPEPVEAESPREVFSGRPPMATTDRYVFAEVDPDAGPKALHLTKPTTTPAPSPEDWQAIEDAVDAWRAIPTLAGGAKGARWHDVASLALAAVRNMREAQNDG